MLNKMADIGTQGRVHKEAERGATQTKTREENYHASGAFFCSQAMSQLHRFYTSSFKDGI